MGLVDAGVGRVGEVPSNLCLMPCLAGSRARLPPLSGGGAAASLAARGAVGEYGRTKAGYTVVDKFWYWRPVATPPTVSPRLDPVLWARTPERWRWRVVGVPIGPLPHFGTAVARGPRSTDREDRVGGGPLRTRHVEVWVGTSHT
jgi:hypothetical protein